MEGGWNGDEDQPWMLGQGGRFYQELEKVLS
jgi:hypothetical protein